MTTHGSAVSAAPEGRGIVILADVIGSRRQPGAAAAWLRRLAGEFDELYGAQRLARFAFTQGDELQGLLQQDADPLRAVLTGTLDEDRMPMRWVVVAGAVEEGTGPATERSGPAFFAARELIGGAPRVRDGLTMRTGAEPADRLLADVAPVLAEMLAELSPRQRTIARLALLEGLRQADVADRLDVSRATVSVTWGRARVRSLGRLADATRTIFADGVAAAAAIDGAGAS